MWNSGERPLPVGSSLPGEVQRVLDTRCPRDPFVDELVEVLNRWAQDMTAWAKAVREDIKAIEDHVGMAHGDPGDPPPVPWK